MSESVESESHETGEDYYAEVPAEQREGLRRFRERYPIRTAEIGGVEWEYRVAGDGGAPLVWLPGALMRADSVWPQAAHFARQHKVIVPSYPPLTTMADLSEGLAGLLAAEGVTSASVVGGSYGGMLAQVFVRQHGERVGRLVLSHTLPPDPRRGMKLAVAAPLFSLMPEAAVLRMYWNRMADLIADEEPESAWLSAYLTELTRDRLSKTDVIALYRRAADFDGQRFAPEDLAEWPGETLLLMADDDPVTPEPVRERMIELYPRAGVHVFSGTGHAAALRRPEEYFGAMESFLAPAR